MAVPLLDKKIIKKRVNKFKRPEHTGAGPKVSTLGSEERSRLPTLMPNIAYGSDKKTRHYLPNGFKKLLVHNAVFPISRS